MRVLPQQWVMVACYFSYLMCFQGSEGITQNTEEPASAQCRRGSIFWKININEKEKEKSIFVRLLWSCNTKDIGEDNM